MEDGGRRPAAVRQDTFDLRSHLRIHGKDIDNAGIVTDSTGTGTVVDNIDPKSIVINSSDPNSIAIDSTDPKSIVIDSTDLNNIVIDSTDLSNIVVDSKDLSNIVVDSTDINNIVINSTDLNNIVIDSIDPNSIAIDNADSTTQADAAGVVGSSDEVVEPRSVLDDDSDGDEDFIEDDDDRSSSLSIPNESIDFDLVYSLHSFAATVEGQANVVKGDRLVLIDDSNSYWWLVRVLKTQEVGYIPAENIETPFERLARLNKHRNVDLASATQAEMQGELNASQDRLRKRTAGNNNKSGRKTPSPVGRGRLQLQSTRRRLVFTSNMSVHRYAPAIWDSDEDEVEDEDEYDEIEYIAIDLDLAEDEREREKLRSEARTVDDEMQWDDDTDVHDAGSEQQQQQTQVQAFAQRRELRSPPARQFFDPADATTDTVRRTITPSVADDGYNVNTTRYRLQQQQQQQQIDERSKRLHEQLDEEELVRVQRSRSGSVASANVNVNTGTGVNQNQNQGQVKSFSPMTATVSGPSPYEQQYLQQPQPQPQSQHQQPRQQDPQQGGQKLIQQRKPDSQSLISASASEDESTNNSGSSGKKKKSGLWSGLFPRKKDKDKEKDKSSKEKVRSDKNASVTSFDSADTRGSEESRSSRPSIATVSHDQHYASVSPAPGGMNVSPTTGLVMQQQERNLTSSGPTSTPTSALTSSPALSSLSASAVSQHASQLRQHDQQQQALYKSYLMSSPLTPPEVSYGLQSARTVLGNTYAPTAAAAVAQTTPTLPSSAADSTIPTIAATTSSNTSLGISTTPRPRPGSLILTTTTTTTTSSANSVDGISTSLVSHQELSVIRVFAGRGLAQLTDATFKTALLNSSTVARDLVKQAIQRFRLPTSHSTVVHGSISSDGAGVEEYYLTVKQIQGGSSIVLRSTDNPLVIFEQLVEEANSNALLLQASDSSSDIPSGRGMGMGLVMPKVKRSSVGSLDSVASNLSMHPAIRKLPMNDFTDDSQVKFYLNRRVGGGVEGLGVEEEDMEVEEVVGREGAEEGNVVFNDIRGSPPIRGGELGGEHQLDDQSPTMAKKPFLTVSTIVDRSHHGPRFPPSPTIRFAVQLIIHKENLPDNMMFHPTAEAIVFKEGHHYNSSPPSLNASTNANSHMRKKVFMFPKTVTVAEVIELGLERFGILEGVVDGGDEVEDKSVNTMSPVGVSAGNGRRKNSGVRVRYGLWMSFDGEERELTPSSKILDAYPSNRPPAFHSPSETTSTSPSAPLQAVKRRSVDSAQLLGNAEDVRPDDPVFFLRRATSYRSVNSTLSGGGFVTRHGRHSAPLDEIALQKMQMLQQQQPKRESVLTIESGLSYAYLTATTTSEKDRTPTQVENSTQMQSQSQLRSAHEIIAAQRAATRAMQNASILSAQSNSLRGTDVLLPDHALLRSSRYDSMERMRYSYVEPDGETYDVSEIVETEWGAGSVIREHSYDVGVGVGNKSSTGENRGMGGLGNGGDDDLLATVVGGRTQQGLGVNLDRVLNRIRNGKVSLGRDKEVVSLAALSGEGTSDIDEDSGLIVQQQQQQQQQRGVLGKGEDKDDDAHDMIVVEGRQRKDRESKESGVSVPSVSEYSVEDSVARSSSLRSTPGSMAFNSHMPSGSAGTDVAITTVVVAAAGVKTQVRRSSEERLERSSPDLPRASTSTPTGRPFAQDRRQPSLASVLSDGTTTSAGYVTPPPHPIVPQIFESPRSFSSYTSMGGSASGTSSSVIKRRGPVIPRDDFGISHMMAIIEYQAKSKENAAVERVGGGKEKEMDVVDERLFGRRVDLGQLHPQVRDIFEDGFKMLEEIDKVLDSYVQPLIGAF